MTDVNSDSMPSLLMQAAQSAAQADGVLPPTSNDSSNSLHQQQQQNALAQMAAQNARAMQLQQQQQQQVAMAVAASNPPPPTSGKKKGPPLRRGKWTPEEEAYANRLIQEFKSGLLPLTDGTTLRTFLSKLLNCDPMRISKKFVGSNCIGKQVFRRRTADLNRLTPEQIAQSRAELSELERRFLERVAQTNRVKSSGVGAGAAANNTASASATVSNNNNNGNANNFMMNNVMMGGKTDLDVLSRQRNTASDPPTPPWLQPPQGYKHGEGAALASSRTAAAAAGRALLGGWNSGSNSNNSNSRFFGNNGNNSSNGLLAELQRRASQQSMLNALQQHQGQNSSQDTSSTNNLLAAAMRSNGSFGGGGNNGSLASLSQLARNLSSSRLGLNSGNNNTNNASINNLMLKTGLSRDQLSQLARSGGGNSGGLSSGSLSNMIQRQSSFDALMSLDFQSIQSIDNLANLIQSGGGGGNIPESGIPNADFGAHPGTQTGGSNMNNTSSSQDLARRLTSQGRMESLLRNLSSHNVRDGNGVSNSNLSNLLQSMQNFGGNNSGAANSSAANLFNNNNNNGGGNNNPNNSAVSLANLFRQDSSTGLTALRMQDGLTAQRNSSIDDFLSLMAAGDIPHQDPSMLNVPLMHQQQHGGDAASNNVKLLLQQQQQQQLQQHLLQMQQNASGNNKRSLDEVNGGLPEQGDLKRTHEV